MFSMVWFVLATDVLVLPASDTFLHESLVFEPLTFRFMLEGHSAGRYDQYFIL